jgi:outer membrane protein assembly factor BamB
MEKPRLTKNKVVTATTLLLMLIVTFFAFTGCVLVAVAADVTSYAFLAVSPNPIGVNQPVQVSMWVSPVPSSYPDVFHNFEVTITKPDGTSETRGPFTAFLTGNQYFSYTPDAVGNYTFQFTYPGETFSNGDVWLPVTTPPTTLMVQQNPIESFPETPVPTGYWTRPINAEHRNWDIISGNWLMRNYRFSHNAFYGDAASGYNPYSQAPKSAHIMWTREVSLGGLVGGTSGSNSYYSGQSYDPYLVPPVIMNGRLYYHTHKSGGVFQGATPGVICVDLRTGEKLWQNDQAYINVGQLYLSTSFNGQGILPYLWDTEGSTWDVYDPFSGEYMLSFDNATIGKNLWYQDHIEYDETGSMLVYLLDGENNWFAMWNSSRAFEENAVAGFYALSPYVGTYDWMLGVQWNVTIPEHHVYDDYAGLLYPVKHGVSDNVLVAKVGDGNLLVYAEVGYDMTTGQELWYRDSGVQTWFSVYGEGIYASFSLQEMTWTGYDIKTGNQIWVSDPNVYPFGSYVNYVPCIADGKLYSGSFDGYMHAFDIETGKEVWKFYSGNSGLETVTGTYIFWNGPIIAGGVVFAGTGEETPTQPLTRGNKIFALDAATGKEIWSIKGYMNLRAIADGYLVGYNGYDNRIYCFGKGPSATTVSVPQTAIHAGSSIMITGTVTDQSTGQMDTPAISDEDMGEWMEYLYMQKQKPENAKGVTVKLTAVDSNGNTHELGTVTSDMFGKFGKSWAPQEEGDYQIIAIFEGSESYGSSSDSTYLTVGSSSSVSGITIELLIVLAVIAAAVICFIAYMLLRKQ